MSRTGFVYRIGADGVILEVLHDGLGLGQTGAAFISVLDPGSLSKGLAFLRELQESSLALAWELDVVGEPRATRMRVGGVRDGEGAVVLATSDGQFDHFLAQITGVNNELSTRLREALRGQAAADDLDAQLQDMARLNNDLTNLHRELAQKSAELEQLNRRKDEMLGMAAHDLRNPLGAIMGFAELLEVRAADRLTEPELALLGHVRTSSRRMVRLVDDLLDVSAIAAGALRLELEHGDVTPIIREVVALEVPGAQRKDIEFVLETPHAPVEALIDAEKFGQVVSNLVSNAVKYSHGGTTVRVVLTQDEAAVSLTVIDQGQGIPASDLGSLFQPFARADVRTTAGESSTGLGLAIVKNIVEGHGGTIAVTSEVGVGSAFEVRVPADAAER